VFVELIESLRCPRAHEATSLVASATRTVARHIVDGVLGCPMCGAEFVVRDGMLTIDEPLARPDPEPADPNAGMRLAALLGLTDAHGLALLCGRWGAMADAVQAIVETPLVVVNPPRDATATMTSATLLARDALPFAPATARAAAYDESTAPLVPAILAAVRSGGRLLAPVTMLVPAGVTEIARDEHVWIAEKAATAAAAPRLVKLERGAR
jgi:hypothetical protein